MKLLSTFLLETVIYIMMENITFIAAIPLCVSVLFIHARFLSAIVIVFTTIMAVSVAPFNSKCYTPDELIIKFVAFHIKKACLVLQTMISVLYVVCLFISRTIMQTLQKSMHDI